MAERKPKRNEPAKRPAPKRTGKPLNVWIAAELRDALDALIDESRPRTSLTAVVEVAIEEYLARHGRWPADQQQPPS